MSCGLLLTTLGTSSAHSPPVLFNLLEVSLLPYVYNGKLLTREDSAGAAIGFIFTAQSAPRYLKGLYFAVGMTIMSMILTAITVISKPSS